MISEEDEDKVLRSVRVIFGKGINPDEKWLRYFLLLLQGADLIAKNQKRHLEKLLKDRGCKDVLNELLILIEAKEDGWQEFAEVLDDEDLQIDARIKEILHAILTSDQLVNEKLCLVLLWDELVEDYDGLKVIIEDIWNGYECFNDGDWPLSFVHFCLTDSTTADNQERLGKFIYSVSSLKSAAIQRSNSGEAEEDKTLPCLTRILRECMGNDKKKLRYLNLLLRGENIVDKEKKRTIDVMIRNNENDEALLEMISLVDASERGIKYFEEFFSDEDFDIESEVQDLVSAVLKEEQLEDSKLKLILLWPELIESRDDVKPVIHDIWQDNKGLTDTNWPLNFIHFCVTQHGEGVQHVEDFVSSISFLQPTSGKEETPPLSPGTPPGHDYPDSSVQNEAPSLELESFVILDTPENSGSSDTSDGGNKEAPQDGKETEDAEGNLEVKTEMSTMEKTEVKDDDSEQQTENVADQENLESEENAHQETSQQNQSHLQESLANAESISLKSAENAGASMEQTNKRVEDASWEMTGGDSYKDKQTEEPPLEYRSESSSLVPSINQDDHDHGETPMISHQENSINMSHESSARIDAESSSVDNGTGSIDDQQAKNPEAQKEIQEEVVEKETAGPEQGHSPDPSQNAQNRQGPEGIEMSDSDSDEDDNTQTPADQLPPGDSNLKPQTMLNNKNDGTPNVSQEEKDEKMKDDPSTQDRPQNTIQDESLDSDEDSQARKPLQQPPSPEGSLKPPVKHSHGNDDAADTSQQEGDVQAEDDLLAQNRLQNTILSEKSNEDAQTRIDPSDSSDTELSDDNEDAIRDQAEVVVLKSEGQQNNDETEENEPKHQGSSVDNSNEKTVSGLMGASNQQDGLVTENQTDNGPPAGSHWYDDDADEEDDEGTWNEDEDPAYSDLIKQLQEASQPLKSTANNSYTDLQPDATRSQTETDFLLAQELQMETALEDSCQQQQQKNVGWKSRVANAWYNWGFGDSAKAEIEIRVMISQPKNHIGDGWFPVLCSGDRKFVMHRHELGYHYVKLTCGERFEHQYRYMLVKKQGKNIHHIKESLLKKQAKHSVTVHKGCENVILDVAIFGKKQKLLKTWGDEITCCMRSYLPHASCIHSDLFCVNDTYRWLHQAQQGWDLRNPTKYHKLSMETIEDQLEDWLRSIVENETPMHIVRNIICSLSIIVAMYKKEYKIQTVGLFHKICEGLQVHGLNMQFQEMLCTRIQKEFNDRALLLQSIKFFLERLVDFPNLIVLLVVPLYRLISVNGVLLGHQIELWSPNMLSDRAWLPTIDQTTWESFRQRIIKTNDPKKLKKLVGMSTIVTVLAKTHPYIIDTYFYFISFEMLMNLIKEKNVAVEIFQIDSVFAKLLPMLEPQRFSAKPGKRNDIVKRVIKNTTQYLEDQFLKQMDSNQLARLEDERKRLLGKKSFQLMESIKNTLASIVQAHYFDSLERQSILWLLTMAGHCMSWSTSLNRPTTEFSTITIANDFIQLVRNNMYECQLQTRKIEDKQFQFYSNVLHKKWLDKEFQTVWRNEIVTEVESCIEEQWSNVDHAGAYLEFYGKISTKDYHPALNEILLLKATKSARDLLIFTNKASAIRMLTRNGILKPFANALTNAFTEYDAEETNFDIKALKFMAESPLVLTLYGNLDGEDITRLFTSKSFSKLNEVHKKAQSLPQSISEKTITVTEMRIILKNRERMEELLSIIERNKHAPTTQPTTAKQGSKEVKFLLKMSEVILESLDEKINALKFFIDFCSSLHNDGVRVQCNDLKEKLKGENSLMTLKDSIKNFIDGSDIDEMILITHLKSSSVLVVITHEVVARKVERVLPSSLVNGVWMVDWKIALHEIWEEIKNKLVDVINNLKEGLLNPEDITRIFQETEGDAKKLKKELRLLYCFHAAHCKEERGNEHLEKQASKTARLLVNIFDLQRNLKVLEWFSNFRIIHNLKGDFAIIDNYQKNYQNLSEQHFDRLKKLTSIKSQQFDTLQAFGSQSNLIEWLQTTTKEGQDDVRALCLVAEESSRHELMDADRWTFLNEAVDGFHDLVFNLEKIEGIEGLISRCEKVWKKIEEDPSLVKKWVDAGQCVDWYKSNAEWFGSEETGALNFAQKANRQGIYSVGNVGDAVDACLENSIKLQLAPQKGENREQEHSNSDMTDKKEISIAKLHDVESKLMLIANEGTDGAREIRQFVATLTAMEGLAKAYVDLVSAGFLLFNEWKLTASVSPSEESDMVSQNLLTLHVTFKEGLQSLNQAASIRDINMLSDVLRNALTRWNKHISRMRLEHYFLNEYSIEQIKYLCEQLGKIEVSPLKDQAYILLSNLPRFLLVELIRESLDEALAFSEEDTAGNYDSIDNEAVSNITKEHAEIRKKRHAVRQLVNQENVSEKLAKAAVEAEGYADPVKCSNWITIYEYDQDEIEERSRAFDQAVGFVHEETDIQVDISVLQDKSARTLKGMIKLLQQSANAGDILVALKTIVSGYLRNTKAIAMKDYLSVHHLGKFLTILRKKLQDIEPQPVRLLQEPYTTGRPNLIFAQPREMISLILSLYSSQYNDKTQMAPEHDDNTVSDIKIQEKAPHADEESDDGNANSIKIHARLPLPDEVLICSENTSQDEVERFMLKAMCKHPIAGVRPVFCMAYTDRLDFSASQVIESTFASLSKGNEHVNEQYQLVLLSSATDHYVSVIFSKYRLEKTPRIDQSIIDDYILREMNAKVIPDYKRVTVVTSKRSGVGKSLYVKRLSENLPANCSARTVRLLEKNIDMESVIKRLCQDEQMENEKLVHIDLSPAVEKEIEKFIFDLLILGLIKDRAGKVWRRRENHSYVIEVTKQPQRGLLSHTLELLPTVTCISPVEVLHCLRKDQNPEGHLLMDVDEYLSDAFQRTSQYLLHYERKHDLSKFYFKSGGAVVGQVDLIEVFLRHCGIEYPTWAQLKHFISFLNVQLVNCEKSYFCQSELARELKGLKELAVKFMINMARDFATPSLEISDESANDLGENAEQEEQTGDIPEGYKMRRKWEEYEHPYMFFNDDGHSMTFINVNIDDKGDLYDKDGELIEKGITSKNLVKLLKRQGFKFGYNFHKLARDDMVGTLCQIMGVNIPYDPDETYELTTDNVLKMIAIYMRLRCGIPVIIMGETGCGKTRMIEFMSELQAGRPVEGKSPRASMKNVKVHGGIEVSDIFKSVRDVLMENTLEENFEGNRQLTAENQASGGTTQKMRKIIFYDEANTTTAIYAIKEVMCDQSINGDSFSVTDDQQTSAPMLQIVAACNPYKQLSQEALKKLEETGLGYRISADATVEKLDNIAMRTLVYRVVALPPSIQPFVWDFGQLSDATEKIYIRNMISSKLTQKYNLTQGECNAIASVLSHIQTYMRERKDECRYVSLRDIERTIILFEWFQSHQDDLFPKMDKSLESRYPPHPTILKSLRNLIHAVGVSYHASLENRQEFRAQVSTALFKVGTDISQHSIRVEYEACQTIFHRDLKAGGNIAWNEALRENVFLIGICADTKLPLYIVGKPGSSKSLAKSIVEANMKGSLSTSAIFKKLKKVDVIPFQCSALTKASGIEKAFQDAKKKQEKQDLNKVTSLVVLDEIGLAEDSPNMPLKILHPLLECGDARTGSLKKSNKKNKVAFLGISNWALDPAKMNRGIFVTRNKPVEEDLFETAKGIFQGSAAKINQHQTTLENLTKTYMQIYSEQGDQYFGLRDYYSLIKMIHSMTNSDEEITKEQLAYVLVRNFSGGSKKHTQALQQAARKHVEVHPNLLARIPLQQMINDGIENPSSRFLLLLTKHHSSVHLLHHIFPQFDKKANVLFGSSFPGDHTYTELCKNINKIKVCMEQGKFVVSLNMADIHESLYDVLNQHYVKFGERRYVAIGLGSHRVWTRVHENFRFIVIEKEEVAHERYPIPLLNRLEKHHLTSKDLLPQAQLAACEKLSQWTKEFSQGNNFTAANAFPGMHEDTTSSVVLAYSNEGLENHKSVMLNIATADSIFRLQKSKLHEKERERITKLYMEEQAHDCLFNLMRKLKDDSQRIHVLEVVSYSNILTEEMRKKLEKKLQLIKNSVMLLSLQQFKVEEDYGKKIEDFFDRCKEEPKNQGNQSPLKATDMKSVNAAILLIQVSRAHENGQLAECAKYYFMNKFSEEDKNSFKVDKVIVIFILATERLTERNGHSSKLIIQPTRKYQSVYIDELGYTKSNASTTLMTSFYGKSMEDILNDGKANLENEDNFVLCLLQDCIVEAMSKLADADNQSRRQVDRIKTFREISRGIKSSRPDVNVAFLGILLSKMITIYQSSQGNSNQGINWVVEEACSQEKLLKGGTFGKTVNLCLKRNLSQMLAFIVSIIDENGNMSILVTNETGMEWKFDLWLRFFHSLELRSPAQIQLEYAVKSSVTSNSETSCKFPYSFVVNSIFQDMYNASKERPDPADQEIFFYNRIKNSEDKRLSILQDTWDKSNKTKMVETYLHDLLRYKFKRDIASGNEIEALTKIMFKYSWQRWDALGREFNGLAVAFFNFIELSEQLINISQIFSIYCETMEEVDAWAKKQSNCSTFVMHEYALNSMLDHAYNKASCINNDRSCIEWMNTSSRIRQIYQNLVNMVQSTESKQSLHKKWKPIGLLDTLLIHLLPWNNKHPQYVKYIGIVVDQAMRFFRAIEQRGFHSKEVLKIISNISRKSYEDVRINLMIDWAKPTCVCKRGFQHPVKMPCGKFACQTCATMAAEESHICPYCSEKLPENFDTSPPALTKSQKRELEIFKANCTGFFIEYLNDYCFGDDTDKEVKVNAIFHGTIHPRATKTEKDKFKLETSQLDLNLSTRSSIVSLLQRLHPEFIKDTMKELLASAALEENTLLVMLKALEANCSRIDSSISESEYSNRILEESWLKLLDHGEKLMTYDMLEDVARVRFALSVFVRCVYKYSSSDKMTPSIIMRVADLYNRKNSDKLMNLITKLGLMHHGRQWFSHIQKIQQLKYMMERSGHLADVEETTLDLWEIFGEDYKDFSIEIVNSVVTARANLRATLQRDKGVLKKAKIMKILAVVNCQIIDGNMKKEVQGTLKRNEAQILLHGSENLKRNLNTIDGLTSREVHMLYQLVLSTVGAILCKGPMMQELYNIVMHPESTKDLIWPAMPESLYHSMIDAMDREAAYSCPKGHVYFIGDCTYPWMMSQCPECGCAIGGFLHMAATGNTRLPTGEVSKTGYQLQEKMAGVDDPADRITPQAAAVIQFYIHLCMIMALSNKKTSKQVLSMIWKDNLQEGFEFLVTKLKENIEEMSKSLGCTADDGLLILQQVNTAIMDCDTLQAVDTTLNWNTKENCERWEKEFRIACLQPIFYEAEKHIFEAKQKLSVMDGIDRILLEGNEGMDGRLTCFHPVVWTALREPSSEHLLHSIIDSPEPGAILKTILETPNLHFVKRLQGILKLQSKLIAKYRYEHDMKDMDKIKFDTVMKEYNDHEMTTLVQSYIDLWNQVHPALGARNPKDRVLAENMKRINTNSPVTMALPCIRGKGRCAKLLAEYLIQIQNDFLDNCKAADSSIEGISEVEVPKLLDFHYVCIDKRQDLLPMIQHHTSYTITNERGQHHQITYNIAALEKLVKVKHVMYKRKIVKESLPCIRYADTGIGSDWNKVNETVTQEPLPSQTVQEVNEMANRLPLAEICEGVRTLTQAISFLAKVKVPNESKTKTLRDYLESDLMLSANHVAMIPRSILISQTLALYQKLTCHKAIRFVQQGLEPYKECLQKEEQEKIRDPELLKKLKNSFANMDVNALQEHINEMLISQDITEFNPNWSLKDILPELEYLQETGVDTWYSNLPEEVQFKHVSDLFRWSVEGILIVE